MMANNDKLRSFALFLFPLILLASVIMFFITFGPLGLIGAGFPPVEKLAFENVIFEEGKVTAHIINDGPDEVAISQVLVNDAYNVFEISPSNTLKPLERATVSFSYLWVFAEPLKITLLTNDGLTFDREVGVPFITPLPTLELAKSFAIIGIYVSVIPVLLGFLWLPFLRALNNEKWYHFFLSITLGLLAFLAFDALTEAIELAGEVPQSHQGLNLVLIAFVSSLLIMLAASRGEKSETESKKEEKRLLKLAYLIAIAVGIHNFGEGLAIGAAYSLGEISLGTLLVIGFMAHNVTEGLAIIAPVSRSTMPIRNFLGHMLLLGLIAGAPSIPGILLSAFSYSKTLSLIFLAIGSAAALQVIIEIANHMKKERLDTLLTLSNSFGIILGLLIMYITGILVF